MWRGVPGRASAFRRILEFYAATEGNVSLFNVEGRPGAIGRIPPSWFTAFRSRWCSFDVETGNPIRDENGSLPSAARPDEIGEAIGQIADPSRR